MKKPMLLVFGLLLLGIVSSFIKQPQVTAEQSTPTVVGVHISTPLPTVIPPADKSAFGQIDVVANQQIADEITFFHLTQEEITVITQGSQNVKFSSLPAVSGFGPPCQPGSYFYQTGYSFNIYSHSGLDGACSNSIIAAASAGSVTYTGWIENNLVEYQRFWSSGYTAIVEHNIDGMKCYTAYGHLASFSVSPGDPVVAGQKLGPMGSTGNSSGPHLHYVIACEIDGKFTWLDPAQNGALGTR